MPDITAKLLLPGAGDNFGEADGRSSLLLFNVPRLSTLLIRSRPRSSNVLGLNSSFGSDEASLIFL